MNYISWRVCKQCQQSN